MGIEEQELELRYPNTPGYKEEDTSRAAAEAMEPNALTIRLKIVESLTWVGEQTADEVAERLGLSVLSVRPRFSELLARGSIADTGMRRANISGKSAKVWRVTKK